MDQDAAGGFPTNYTTRAPIVFARYINFARLEEVHAYCSSEHVLTAGLRAITATGTYMANSSRLPIAVPELEEALRVLVELDFTRFVWAPCYTR